MWRDRHRSMPQRESRNKSTQIGFDLWLSCENNSIREKVDFLTNGVRTIGYLYSEKKVLDLLWHLIQKVTQNGLLT